MKAQCAICNLEGHCADQCPDASGISEDSDSQFESDSEPNSDEED